MKQYKQLSGWANYPRVEAEIIEPASPIEMKQYILDNEHVIARGNGKSYGDASLGKHVISTLALCQILHFDPMEGNIECEAGVLFSNLLPTIVAAGWFFSVTPGTKNITVGGAIASDVHGKNHPTHGCFSNGLISFELMTADGSILTCSREQNSSLFWQTCGGMGWTGVILSARFQLMRIRSTQMKQKTIQCQNLEALFQTFEEHRAVSYAAGWIDTTSSGATFGRGALHTAEHLEEKSTMAWMEGRVKSIPFMAPSQLLNPLSIRAFNAMYFYRNRSGERVVDMNSFFYPLDGLEHWNRLYGSLGFVQYQFCLPEETAFNGIRQIMETVRKSREVPFLSVLKRHGKRPQKAVNSFPIQGYSLALDFPRTRGIFDLVKKLDAQVWDLGGKIYLTKDSCSEAKMGRLNLAGFDNTKFWSTLRERIVIPH